MVYSTAIAGPWGWYEKQKCSPSLLHRGWLASKSLMMIKRASISWNISIFVICREKLT
jgi:hypothetical protein